MLIAVVGGWLRIAAVAGLGWAVGACLVELEHRIACGDGYVDELAGEQCDPNDPDSFENACENTTRPRGTAACDPVTCEIIDDRLQCAYCGDGVLDDDFIDEAQTIRLEECDGTIVPGLCPSGSGQLGCTSDCRIDPSKCDRCGDGVPDPGEECDPGGGDIVVPQPCGGGGGFAALPTPYVSYPFTSGYTTRCLADCTFDRSECGYCGNGVADSPRFTAISEHQLADMTEPEQCDGDDTNPAEIADAFPQCTGDFVTANVGCAADCTFVLRDGPPCCLETAAPCPADDDAARCCHEYSVPKADEHCSNPFLVPGAEDPTEGGGSTCN